MEFRAQRPRFAISLVLIVACGAAGESPRQEPQDAVARPVLTIDLEAEPRAVVDVLDAVGSELQRVPIGARLRPVEVLEVLDVHRLRLRTDRGVELVRAQWLGGADPRMPDEVRDYFEGPARDAVEAWLRAPFGKVYEASLQEYGDRGAAAGPSYTDREGLRVVTLVRGHPAGLDGGEEELLDLHMVAIQNGWAYPAHPLQDLLALEPRAIHALTTKGYGALATARELREEYAADRAKVGAMSTTELQEIGARIHEQLTRYFDWKPKMEASFVALDPEAALELMSEIYARDGLELEAGNGDAEPDPTTLLAEHLEEIDAFAPLGPTIYFIRKGRLSLRQLEAVLAHELVHQYQEEVAGGDYPFPPAMMPDGVLEGHAEYLAVDFRTAKCAGFETDAPIDYYDAVGHFGAILEATGLSPDELYEKYLGEEWSRDPWNDLLDSRTSLQEFLFDQCRITEFAGLDFAPVEGSGLSEENGPVVEITNRGEETFRGQFHGWWTWTVADGRGERVTVESPPFNLVLPAGESVGIRIAQRGIWAESPAEHVTGLFSVTPRD